MSAKSVCMRIASTLLTCCAKVTAAFVPARMDWVSGLADLRGTLLDFTTVKPRTCPTTPLSRVLWPASVPSMKRESCSSKA